MSKLPFGLPQLKDITMKRNEFQDAQAAQYEQKLAEYRKTLEGYKKLYSEKLESYDKILEAAPKTDKESIQKLLSQTESLAATLVETNLKLEAMDKRIINNLSNNQLELQKETVYQNKQMNSELLDNLNMLRKEVKKGNTLSVFLIIFSILGLSGIAFLIYLLEYLPFS